MNCHNPVAPTLDFALGLKADSTTAKYFISNGILYLSKCASNIGKYKALNAIIFSIKGLRFFKYDFITDSNPGLYSILKGLLLSR